MFFTKVGSLVAWAAFVVGVLMQALGLVHASSNMDAEAIAQILGGRTTGAYVDKGMYYMLFGIGLGIATEVSRAVINGAKRVADSKG